MKFILKNIKIENFLSLGNANVDLNDKGYCLINGVNNNPDDNAKSNGAGKSSLIEAICWAITGETVRGVKDVVNMFTEGGCSVDLTFSVDSDDYRIIRYKDHSKYKTDLKIYINGEDKSGKGIRDSQKLLESYLPDLTSSLIGSVIVLGQGLPQRFTNNTPAGRKEVLEKLSKSDFMIDDLKKRLTERKLYLNKELRTVEDNILTTETLINSLTQQIVQAQERLKQLEDPAVYDDLISRAEEKLAYIDSKIDELKDNLKQQRLKLNNSQDLKSQKLSTILEEEREANSQFLEIKYSTESELTVARSDERKLLEDIRKAKDVKDTCPTCGRKFEGVFKPDTTDLENQWKEKKQLKETLEIKLVDLQNKNVELKRQFEKQKLEATADIDREILEYQAHIQSLEKNLGILQDDRDRENSSLSKYQSLKASYQATLKTINETIATNTSDIEKLKENSVYYYDDKNQYLNRIDIINKFTNITNRDFRGYLLKNVIDFIDKKAKEYSKDIFDTEALTFCLDGNNIDISYCDKQYETLSGGEKQKLDLIIQFAIRDMLCQFLDFRCNIICIDEIFDNLDSVGCDKVIDLISTKLSDIESIFIISHHSDLAIPSDSMITVVKGSDGVSYLQ